MRIHLDPVGGVAGDMFAAALLDTFPEWHDDLMAAFHAARLTRIATIAREAYGDGVLEGSRFKVEPAPPEPAASGADGHDHGHEHRHIKEIRAIITGSGLSQPVQARALAIFELLAHAEAAVHGKAFETVAFHEVGAWDSIADIICAAWLIDRAERSGVTGWSCATLPQGRGRTVPGAHGILPVPSPATLRLLEGYPMANLDDARGERITPTGAAILKHLDPHFGPNAEPHVLRRHGIGFGTMRFEGFSNILRALVFEPADQAASGESGIVSEQVLECRFEVDDQSPEDLAIGLDIIRAADGVLDVSQSTMQGKKGRLGSRITVLARPESREIALQACFAQTTTLGVRWQLVQRTVLERHIGEVTLPQGAVRYKEARRPGGATSVKAELDDVAPLSSTQVEREELRHTIATRREPGSN